MKRKDDRKKCCNILHEAHPPTLLLSLSDPPPLASFFPVDFMCKYEKISFYCHNASKFCENLLRIRNVVQ